MQNNVTISSFCCKIYSNGSVDLKFTVSIHSIYTKMNYCFDISCFYSYENKNVVEIYIKNITHQYPHDVLEVLNNLKNILLDKAKGLEYIAENVISFKDYIQSNLIKEENK